LIEIPGLKTNKKGLDKLQALLQRGLNYLMRPKAVMTKSDPAAAVASAMIIKPLAVAPPVPRVKPGWTPAFVPLEWMTLLAVKLATGAMA